MSEGAPLELDFSNWDGMPFFRGQLKKGRHVYVVKRAEGAFLGYVLVDPEPRYLFIVHGASTDELKRFVTQVESEGAMVTYDLPPFETKAGTEMLSERIPAPGYKGSKPEFPR